MGPHVGRVRWEEAIKDLETDYTNRDQSSWDDARRRLALHLTPVFKTSIPGSNPGGASITSR